MNTKFLNAATERPELHEAQNFVGGYVQLVGSQIYPNTQLLVDEEGLCKNLPINPLASRVAGFMVVGPALVLTGDARWLPD
jgi:hypothetical protein